MLPLNLIPLIAVTFSTPTPMNNSYFVKKVAAKQSSNFKAAFPE
jgi:hypothetical protein